MGCNMCVVQKPEEQYKVMLQVNGKELSKLSQEQTLEALRASKEPLVIQVLRRSPRLRGDSSCHDLQLVDSGTQTDITFEHIMALGKLRPPTPPMGILEPYVLSELPPISHEYYDPAEFMEGGPQEAERMDELEYEEVELCKNSHQDKLGLMVCYRTDEEEDLGIYVGEVNPNSIAAKDGRIREGDRIIQINGMDVQNREEAVAILSQEENTNISLLVARPESQLAKRWKDSDRDDFLDDFGSENEGDLRARKLKSPPVQQIGNDEKGAPDGGPGLNNSQDLDSGVGRTDESTRNEESSEHDLLGDEPPSTTNTPGSLRKFGLQGDALQSSKILPLTGIPVLFLPGNAGSYKQVRSIGSIALRKAEDIDFKYHFDFFSVNFNEELVALYGGSLQKQTKFVHECIKAILKLYKGQEFAPTSVAIIGHSMGGLVARALLTLKNFKQDLINLLVTQATPHVAPVMPLDRFITEFYMNVNNYWILNARHINLTTLSVAGGFRDYQVRSGLTFLPKLSHYTSALSVVSSAVPKTWVSTDHLSIVWCKQLQLTTIRAFFDLIDADTKQITQKPKKKLSVLNHHFIRHPAKQFEENPSIISDLTGTSMWVPVKVSRWSYVAYNESDKIYFAFPLANHRKIYTHAYCQSTMLDTNSWIFGCINSTSMCRQGVDLSWKAELLPTIKSLTLRLQDYPSLSHIVVYVPSVHGSKFVVDCEFFKKEARSMQLPVTHLFSFGLSSRKVTLNTNGLYYNIELLNFGQIYQAFKVNVVSKCTGSKEEITSIYKLHIPWSYEDSLTIAQVPSSTDISLKLHVAQPENDSHVALLKMYTSSDCQYEVTIKTSFPQILGQVVRFHGGALPAYVVSSILLAYGGQLYSLLSTGYCLEYSTILDKEAKPYKVDPFVIMIKFLLGYKWFKELWDAVLLPELDAIVLTSQSMCFPLVSLILFLFGTCTAYWSGLLSSTSVQLLSSLWLALKRPAELPKDIKVMSPDLPVLTVVFLIVSWTTCGALAILLSYLYYVFKVVHLQASLTTFKNNQPVNPKHSRRSEKKSNHHKDSAVQSLRLCANDAEDSLRMHSTVINLLTWVVLLSMPSLIYWLKNLRYYFKLSPDPCKPLAFLLIPAIAILGNTHTVSVKSSKLLKTVSQFPLPLAVGVIAFGSSHLYRVPCFVIIPLVFHALCNFM